MVSWPHARNANVATHSAGASHAMTTKYDMTGQQSFLRVSANHLVWHASDSIGLLLRPTVAKVMSVGR
jgi:hypothetical protein